MPKRDYNKIKSLTAEGLHAFYKDSKKLDEYDKEEFYIGPYEFGKELSKFGKYTDFEPPKKSLKSFFKNKDLKERYEDYELQVVTKEFLAYIIESYTKRVQGFYLRMITPFLSNPEFLSTVKTEFGHPDNNYKFDFTKITPEQQKALFEIIDHVRGFSMEWNQLLPYDLEKGEEITKSWKYEYGVFELVRIYKSFDWKKNVMYYYGY